MTPPLAAQGVSAKPARADASSRPHHCRLRPFWCCQFSNQSSKPGPSHNQIAKQKVRASVCKWACLRRDPRELEQGGRADRVTDRAAVTGRCCELSVVPV